MNAPNNKGTVLDTMPMMKAIIAAKKAIDADSQNSSKMAGRLVCLEEADSTSPRITFKTKEEVQEGEAEEAFKKIHDRLAEGSRPTFAFHIQCIFLTQATKAKQENILGFEGFNNAYRQIFLRHAFYFEFNQPAEPQQQTITNQQPLVANQQSTKGKDNSLLPLIMFLFILFLVSLYYC